jgi:hypothetical protein
VSGPRAPREDWPYLTSMTDRAPRRKHHHTLADAKRAVTVRLDGGRLRNVALVYRWNDLSGWELLWRIPADCREEDLPWNKRERN